MSRISERFSTLKGQSRTALVPFVTAGDPDPGVTVPLMHAMVQAGADMIELGVPFSDPMADGMTIQRSSFKAIENGVTLKWIFDQLAAAEVIDAPLVMMSYLNPLMSFGYDNLAVRARETGVCAFIVPDLPFEESAEIRAALDNEGVGLIQLVTPATPELRVVEQVCLAICPNTWTG